MKKTKQYNEIVDEITRITEDEVKKYVMEVCDEGLGGIGLLAVRLSALELLVKDSQLNKRLDKRLDKIKVKR